MERLGSTLVDCLRHSFLELSSEYSIPNQGLLSSHSSIKPVNCSLATPPLKSTPRTWDGRRKPPSDGSVEWKWPPDGND